MSSATAAAVLVSMAAWAGDNRPRHAVGLGPRTVRAPAAGVGQRRKARKVKKAARRKSRR